MSNTSTTLPDGRSAGLFAAGDPVADRLVVVCHPTGGSATFDPDPVVSSRWGVHLVAFDRPGYGSSAPLPEGASHRLADRADDVGGWLERAERVADRISRTQLRRFGVVGWGTGGLVAAALAARFPDQADRLALVGVPAPAKAAKAARRALVADPSPSVLHVEEDDADLERHPGLLGRVTRMTEAAFLQGRAGVDADRLLMADDSLTDDLHRVRASTRIWVGRRDPVVDDEDVRWWARHLPAAQAAHVRDSGPLAVAAVWSRVLEHVAPRQGDLQEGERDAVGVRVARVDPVHPEHG